DGDRDLLIGATVAELLSQEQRSREAATASNDPSSPWAIADGWRLGHGGRRSLAFVRRDERLELQAQGSSGEYRIEIPTQSEAAYVVNGARLRGSELSLRIDGRARRLSALGDGTRVVMHDGERRLRLDAVPMYHHQQSTASGSGNHVNAPMPGRVVVVKAAPGDSVEAGQEVMVIEAMKMELSLKSPRAGTIAEVRAAAGDFVEADAVLVTLEIV
ncbi:MAG: 3-methylcrotonyl-CoA carboxylase, partial [Lysobacter sp.]|nr:3-methylcrotonyl-CoA carboxylase [Lysobacter sp.]